MLQFLLALGEIIIMKTLSILFFLIPLLAQGQKQFAPLNTVWNYEGHSLNCQGNHIQYRVEDEIFIDDKDCSVIYSYHSDDANPTFKSTGDSLIVWENERKVYFLEDSTFYLLFDFTLEVGDTVVYYSPTDRGLLSTDPDAFGDKPIAETYVIEDVIDIVVDNQTLKKFDTWGPASFCYIENLGCTGHRLTGECCFYVASGCFGGLQCYNNGTIEYITDQNFVTPNPACPLPDATNDILSDVEIALFPNPASEFLNIQSTVEFTDISILNLKGELSKSTSYSETIDISSLSSGIYFIRLQAEKGVVIKKFIKE